MAPPAAKKRKKGFASSKKNATDIGDETLAAPSEKRRNPPTDRSASHHEASAELLELFHTVFGNPSSPPPVIDTPLLQGSTHLQQLAQNRHHYTALLASQVWPSMVRCQNRTASTTHSAPEVLNFMQLSRLAAALLSIEYFDGGVTESALHFVQDDQRNALEAWFDALFNSANVSQIKSALDWTIRIHSFSIAWSCLSQQYIPLRSEEKQLCFHSEMFATLCKHIPTQILHKYMPQRYREWYIRQKEFMRNQENTDDVPMDLSSNSSGHPFVILMVQHVLNMMESDTLNVLKQKSKRFVRTNDMDTSEIVSDANNGNSDDEPDEENKIEGDGNYYDDGVSSVDSSDDVSPDSKALMRNDGSSEVTATVMIIETWQLIHRALELLCDLLSTPRTSTFCREPIIAYLHSIHWTIRCRNAIGTSEYSTAPEPMLLTQQLLERLSKWMYCFPTIRTADGEWTHLNSEERRSIYHRRATIFQKMCHRHFPMQLRDIIYSGAGLLCQKPVANGTATTSFLRQALDALSEIELNSLMHKMRLVDIYDTDQDAPGNKYDRKFLLAVLEEYLVVPTDPLDELRNYPLYPTERVLWDFSKVPPGHGGLLEYPVLAIPKLHTRYLSFADYLWRNFELMRLESAYEIRSDLTDVVRRVQPVLRQSSSKSLEYSSGSGLEEVRTVFSGWARMALEMQGRLEIKNVSKPLLGEIHPSQVVVEFSIDLGPCGERVRREWDELGEYDILFLVGIDARRMSGKSAPLIREDIVGARQFVPDEDDRTFPERYGITLVRGCMILQVRDEAGTALHDTSSETQPTGTKRIFRVSLDPTQYTSDLKTATGTDIYNSLNLVVRRHGKVNNFKAVLETIRGLMAGVGSINLVLPKWLQTAVLGYGDPKESTYQSETIKLYAKATAGVANLDSFLDYGDTFLDENHLKLSFDVLTKDIIVDGRNSGDIDVSNKSSRRNYRIRVVQNKSGESRIEVESYKFREELTGNQVRFTPRQVAAIRSGLSPGLSLIVGPPGTGKTDVAVQIIASLYHSFPTQRTIIITHSNAALNDIFQKVMVRGDIEERYLVRLGSGERELQIESTHDFTKQGRVAYSLSRREALLEQVQLLSESLGLSGRAERSSDGAPAYTCETAEYFHCHHIQKRIKKFENEAEKAGLMSSDSNVSMIFPFSKYLNLRDGVVISSSEATSYLEQISSIFAELAEYRPLELLRSQRQRSDYLIQKQARIVAMTCTHAAIARYHLIELGFEYDNVVVEEAGQMLEIESFIPMLLQRGDVSSSSLTNSVSRLKRCCLIGDHNQLPPVIQNMSFAKYSHLDQSLFARLIRLGVPHIQLDQQGRCRPDIANLFNWRYDQLANLDRVVISKPYLVANAGFVHTMQVINVDDFEGKGEITPTPFFYQNVGEAEYAVALFQYMVLIGYKAQSISILTTYNGQKALIDDILSVRCGPGTPLAGIRPLAVSTVDQYQGQQNNIIILSLVRTGSTIGHLRDIRRWVVAVSRARLGLYVLCRLSLFGPRVELQPSMDLLMTDRPTKLQLVIGEQFPTERLCNDAVSDDQVYEVDDVVHMGSIVHQMQENLPNTT